MDLSRRSFLKVTIAVVGGTAILPLGLNPKEIREIFYEPIEYMGGFNPNDKYGIQFPLSCEPWKMPPDMLKEIYKALFKEMRKILPPKTPFEIRAKIAEDFGRNSAIAWYYKPDFRKQSIRKFLKGAPNKWTLNEWGGYLIGGRGVV